MKELVNLLMVALVAYLLFALILFVFQRSFLYYANTQKPTESLLSSEQLLLWPSSDRYFGLVSQNEPASPKGTFVVFHGNAGAAYDRTFYIDALKKLNYRVVLAEYPGYGGRGGKPSEESIVSDAIETLALAQQQFGDPIFLWGESLGAAVVASIIAKTDTPVKGIVLFTPWDSLPALAQTHYWYLPARWLVRDQYNSVDNLKSYDGRIAVILAGNDEVVPIKHGLRLFKSIDAPKRLWTFDAAGHNSIPIAPELPWWREVAEFVSQPTQ